MQSRQAELEERAADAARLGAAPLLTEINLYAPDAAAGRAAAAALTAVEQRGIGWTGWQYKSYAGSRPGGTCTGCGNSFFRPDGRPYRHMVAAVGRPFAAAVAGRAARAALDLKTREFVLAYEVTLPPAGGGLDEAAAAAAAAWETVIAVPHVFEAGDVTVELAGLRSGEASATLERRPGGALSPGVEYGGRTVVTVRASPAASGETLVVRVRPASGPHSAAAEPADSLPGPLP